MDKVVEPKGVCIRVTNDGERTKAVYAGSRGEKGKEKKRGDDNPVREGWPAAGQNTK